MLTYHRTDINNVFFKLYLEKNYFLKIRMVLTFSNKVYSQVKHFLLLVSEK